MANDEFGDFQTPVALVREVLSSIPKLDYQRVLEPTCGVGNFLYGAKDLLPGAQRKGVELQAELAKVAAREGDVVVGDAMSFDFRTGLTWDGQGDLLVVGNPPWVTNSALTGMASENKPDRRNIRGLKGLDAMTGASNFDIAEAIILRLIEQLVLERPVIAMLCKTQVARNVLSYCEQHKLPVSDAELYELDAKRWFGAAVDACLFVVRVNRSVSSYTMKVFGGLGDSIPRKTVGIVNGLMVSDVEMYEYSKAADGVSPIEWRQGIKHDATNVMELVESDGPYTKLGQYVDVEPEYLYPLLKCTDVARARTSTLTKWMIVPQRHTSEDTKNLRSVAPKLYAYLDQNGDALDGRKSSIYRNRSRFCIFGVGPYSFAPFKVAISGMHKEPVFRLVVPIDDRPVVFDDVTYFAPFDNLADAAVSTAILNEEPAQALIAAISFSDSKRPITKKVLQRLDLRVLADLSTQRTISLAAREAARSAGLSLSEEDVLVAIDRARAGFSTQAELPIALVS